MICLKKNRVFSIACSSRFVELGSPQVAKESCVCFECIAADPLLFLVSAASVQ